MSLRSICRILLVTLLTWAMLPLAAQTTSTGQSSTDNNYASPNNASSGALAAPAGDAGETKPAKWEFFGGYSWMNSNSTLSGTKFFLSVPVPVTEELKDAKGGFVVEGSYFFNKWFGITFDTGAHFGNNYDYDEALVGPTFRFPAEHIQPFIHVLGGWTRLSPGFLNSNDVFGLAGGGGIDLKVARHLSLRLAQADYIYAQHNYGAGNPKYVDNVRLSTGLVVLAGIGEELPVSATCSVDKPEVWAGEPVKASVAPRNFNPKHTLTYDWTTNGGKVQGTGDTVTVDTTGVAEGQSYNVSVKVSDPHNKKAITSCQTSFNTKKRLPPTISCQANPNSVTQGDPVTIHSDASSPQGGPVTVAITSSCGVNGQGTDVAVDTSAMQPGSCNVTCTVTDDHGLTGTNTAAFTVNPKPIINPPKNISLRSVYFATAIPTAARPESGLISSQQVTLDDIATSFIQYHNQVPGSKLDLQGFADPRGGEEYNKNLSERRVAITQKYLIAKGVPADAFQTEYFGKDRQLSAEEVKAELDKNPELNQLTPGERTRLLKNMRTIELASNRRVDISLITPDKNTTETTVREYPFRAADWLTLIGGREKPKAGPKTPGKKRPARKSSKSTKKQ